MKRRHGSRGWPARGTAHEDGRRRRATRAAAREGKQREEEEEADGWARRGNFIFFSFFFRAVTTLPPLKKISSQDLGRQEGKDKTRIWLRPYSPRQVTHPRIEVQEHGCGDRLKTHPSEKKSGYSSKIRPD